MVSKKYTVFLIKLRTHGRIAQIFAVYVALIKKAVTTRTTDRSQLITQQ